jgi:hypothetical protein
MVKRDAARSMIVPRVWLTKGCETHRASACVATQELDRRMGKTPDALNAGDLRR